MIEGSSSSRLYKAYYLTNAAVAGRKKSMVQLLVHLLSDFLHLMNAHFHEGFVLCHVRRRVG